MDAVEDIKSRLSIEDVVGEYVELKRAGRNFKGLSPFSNEKTASFMVSPEKQIWHDFSSGKGGNIFSFVMEMEGLDFKGALELLARKSGIDLNLYRTGNTKSNSDLKNRLYDALEAATKFYQVQFSKNQTALEYIFKKRKFTKTTVLDFRIGYAPNSSSGLVTFLSAKGFSKEEIKKAGLATDRYGQFQDMFRGRIMIPLADGQGRIVGFTARLLADNPNAPKYINTPATLLYDKGRHVYGLHLAKEAIRKANFVVVVEGNLDVISSHQAGVLNVVATAGTAMTKMHLKELSKFADDIRLCFDQDNAGINAAERAIELAGDINSNLSILTVTEGKDPDELIQTNVKQWQEVVDRPKYAVDWLIERYQSLYDIQSAQGKKQFTSKIVPFLSKLANKVEKEHYSKKVATLLDVSVEALQITRQQTSKTYKKPLSAKPVVPNDTEKLQEHLLSIIVCDKGSRKAINKMFTATMLSNDNGKKIFAYLQENPKTTISGDSIPQGLQSVSDYVKMLLFIYEEIYAGLEATERRHEFARLQARVIEAYVKQQKNTIIIQFSTAKEQETQKLLEQVKKLDALLVASKE